MKIKTELLKPYKFNEDFFHNIKGTDYEGLKEDIIINGIKVELHVTPSNTILCGHQRWNIAKEINLDEVPVKVIEIDETNEELIKEYVIKDNLLRRHLTTEQKYILIASLSEVYEIGQGKRTDLELSAEVAHSEERDDVLTKTAKSAGVAERTVATARQYKKIIDEKPELRDKKASQVIAQEINNYSQEIELKKLKNYDENMYYLTAKYHEKRFGDEIICVEDSPGENDIREYKDYYPTVTRLSNFFHKDGVEFSLREYADVQNFPKDYKFVGIPRVIKDQIGEAVSPVMGKHIIDKHIVGDKYIELFCGCGGFSANLKNKALWAIDFNKYAGYSYQLNNPSTDVLIHDIRKIDVKEIHKKIGGIDFIIGGPPCQGFSVAGKRLGFKEDTRNRLYLDYLKFVKEFKPKQFIMENVKEILQYKEEIVNDFNDVGYDVFVEKVDGLDIGMKQKRVRVFFIGSRQ